MLVEVDAAATTEALEPELQAHVLGAGDGAAVRSADLERDKGGGEGQRHVSRGYALEQTTPAEAAPEAPAARRRRRRKSYTHKERRETESRKGETMNPRVQDTGEPEKGTVQGAHGSRDKTRRSSPTEDMFVMKAATRRPTDRGDIVNVISESSYTHPACWTDISTLGYPATTRGCQRRRWW